MSTKIFIKYKTVLEYSLHIVTRNVTNYENTYGKVPKKTRGVYSSRHFEIFPIPYFQHFEKLPQNFGGPIKTPYWHIIEHF